MRNNTITIGQFGRPKISHDGRTIVASIPISFRRQGGRKQVLIPANTTSWTPPSPRVDNAMVKAIVRAHRWREMLESRRYANCRELAKAEKINEAYLGRILRLTLLSPAITEAILSGRQLEGLELADLIMPFPIEWEKQSTHFELGTN
jgi:hypothetical protein